MVVMLTDRLGIETGVRIMDTALTVSQDHTRIRICGHLEAVSRDNLNRYCPIILVGELLDHQDCVIDYKVWRPSGGRFHGYETFGISFDGYEEILDAGRIKALRLYVGFE